MDTISRNLAVAVEHIENEARDPGSVLHLYTDDIVQEFPSRGLVLRGKDAIEASYRETFRSMADLSLKPLDRFATEDRVVDDMEVEFTLVGDGLANAPVAIGDRVRLRLVHVFHMRDGKIAREMVHEHYEVLS